MDGAVSIRLPAPLTAASNNKDEAALDSPVISQVQPLAESSDEELLAEVSAGSREALAILFRRYARTVRGIAHRILRDGAEADDLLQDLFLLIHRLANTFDAARGSAKFWIVQMTYRRAISRRQYLDSRHFYTRVPLDDGVLETLDSSFGRSDESAERRLAELDLQKVFGSLSEDQQKTLWLHFIEGYTLDEIAKILGQTKGNIRHHSFRGLERLRKLVFGGELPGARAV